MLTIKDLTRTYSGAIEFKEISEEAYKRLCYFVKILNTGDLESLPKEPVSESHECSTAIRNDVEYEDKAKKDEPKNAVAEPPKKENKRKYITHTENDPAYKQLKELIDYAKNHPEEYEFRPVQTIEFVGEQRERFSGISMISIGKAAELLGLERTRITDKRYPNPRRVRNYPMKKELKVETTENITANTIGTIDGESVSDLKELKNWSFKQAGFLKAKRKQVGLSIKELSDMINYPFSAIQAWENCQAEPSSNAIDAYCSKFGESFRTELKTVS